MTGKKASKIKDEAARDEAAKDECFQKVALLADELIAAHGKDFTMGTFILAARFIAQDLPFSKEHLPEVMKQ